MLTTEEEMFAEVEENPYLAGLYGLINQVRYQRQPFCPLKTLIEGDRACETILTSLCVLSQANDYNRFMDNVTPKPAGGPQGG